MLVGRYLVVVMIGNGKTFSAALRLLLSTIYLLLVRSSGVATVRVRTCWRRGQQGAPFICRAEVCVGECFVRAEFCAPALSIISRRCIRRQRRCLSDALCGVFCDFCMCAFFSR